MLSKPVAEVRQLSGSWLGGPSGDQSGRDDHSDLRSFSKKPSVRGLTNLGRSLRFRIPTNKLVQAVRDAIFENRLFPLPLTRERAVPSGSPVGLSGPINGL